MKIRDGFVSNSSSSSFVVIITKDAFDKAFNEAHPYIQAVIRAMERNKGKFIGVDVVLMGTSDTHGGSSFDYLEVDYDTDNNPMPEDVDRSPYTAWEMFLESIPKDQIITHSEDF